MKREEKNMKERRIEWNDMSSLMKEEVNVIGILKQELFIMGNKDKAVLVLDEYLLVEIERDTAIIKIRHVLTLAKK
ncbi:MAG: hypothetical protein Q7S27_01310 [Nanoarchaeota archaeon]|nr:hypothetical protein [Nanoarchaeota archaeon]